jgi:hypothetical protein
MDQRYDGAGEKSWQNVPNVFFGGIQGLIALVVGVQSNKMP